MILARPGTSKHPVGDGEAADDVDRRHDDREEAQHRPAESSPPCPATTSAPTIAMPEIAFDPDISGVCSVGGTFVITSNPTNIASTNTVT